ncbi:DUF5320 domain-containing protein [Candidatus Woesearchaeota archaeon]|nr:DUF5320 domain-containing protein [Candidatus Woesearchaeota archaeon]
MPGGDGTGPMGTGPIGWGLGPCGRGMRMGWRRFPTQPIEFSKEEKVKILEAEKAEIEKQLNELKQQS